MSALHYSNAASMKYFFGPVLMIVYVIVLTVSGYAQTIAASGSIVATGDSKISFQGKTVILSKITVFHHPWHGNINAGENGLKKMLVVSRHKLLLKRFTDSTLQRLSESAHTRVILHNTRFRDAVLKPFTSSKKIIHRSHAYAGFELIISLDINSHSDLFGTVYLEPFISVAVKLRDDAGKVIWKSEGSAEAKAAPSGNFNAPNGEVYLEEICGYEAAVTLYNAALNKALEGFADGIRVAE